MNKEDFIKAAQSGDMIARYNLAMCYFNEQNYKEVVYWLEQAAGQGLAEANKFLADLYMSDYLKNPEKALYWYKQLANPPYNSKYALVKVGVFYCEGKVIPRDPVAGLEKIAEALSPKGSKLEHGDYYDIAGVFMSGFADRDPRTKSIFENEICIKAYKKSIELLKNCEHPNKDALLEIQTEIISNMEKQIGDFKKIGIPYYNKDEELLKWHKRIDELLKT